MTWTAWITGFTACALCGWPLAPGADRIVVIDLVELGNACCCLRCWRAVAGENRQTAAAWAMRGVAQHLSMRAPRGKWA